MTISAQVSRFLVVGVINTAVDVGVFAALVGFTAIGPVPANVVSYASGIVSSYLLNAGWTFARDDRPRYDWSRFLATAGASLAVLALSTTLVALLVGVMPAIAAKLVATAAAIAVNFGLLHRILG